MPSTMKRRGFLKSFLGFIAAAAIPFPFFVQRVAAKAAKILLPKGTNEKTLVDKNPADLDTRLLDTTPLDKFGIMGLSDYKVDLTKWRLIISGAVRKPLALSYEDLLGLPAVQRNVLLICPGFFANHGAWRGVSIGLLLRMAEVEDGITYVTLRGPEGSYEKTQRFPLEDIHSEKVFLAYQINGAPLPEKHGFPLRAIAEGYYGSDWVKYVYRMEAERI